MTIACCDPTQLPAANRGAKRQLMQPNHITIPGRSSVFAIDIDHPAVIVPASAPAATLYATPMQPANTSALADSYSSPGALFLPAPGKWFIYYDTTSALTAVVLDAYSTSAMLASGAAKIQIAGGVSGASADVRNADADADFAAALNGLVVNARIGGVDVGGGDWSRIASDVPSSLDGVSYSGAGIQSLLTAAFLQGRDLTSGGAGVIRPIEARAPADFDNSSQSTLRALMTASQGMVREPVAGTTRIIGGLLETTATPAAQGTIQMRASGYWAGLRSRKYTIATGPNVAFPLSTNAFTATDPSVLITPPATNEWVLRRLRFRPFDVLTAGTMRLCVVVDPDARYSSGGTSFIPTNGFQATNLGSPAQVTPTQARTNSGAAIVATAADNDEWFSGDFHIGAYTEDYTIFEFDDGLICPPSGTILIYYFGAPTLEFGFALDIESANIQ